MNQIDTTRQEKNLAAFTSVLAAIGLTSVKIIVGLATGSLGILAEAAHSGLDLAAALMTLFAVRYSTRPADTTHQYGHGKMENLSAFFEGGLLTITALWVIYEALQRLFFHPTHIEVSFWAFAIMLLSIVVDYSRSRMLFRVAKHVGSQALEADALHFSTDIWSSSVVIAGLAIVWISQRFSLPSWLQQADAIAALGVSCIVLWVSFHLIRETMDALLDHAPGNLPAEITTKLAQLSTVNEVRQIRMRRVGKKYFTDVLVTTPRTATFTQIHILTEQIKTVIAQIIRSIDITADIDTIIQIEPITAANESLYERIFQLALESYIHIHDLCIRQVDSLLEVDFDIEVPGEHTLEEVHVIASRLEQNIKQDIPAIVRVTSHLEAPSSTILHSKDVTNQQKELVEAICQIATQITETASPHDIHVFKNVDEAQSNSFDIMFHTCFPKQMSIQQVHNQAEVIKRALRIQYPFLGAIIIHTEPPDALY